MNFTELKENFFIDEQSEQRRSVRYNILNSAIIFNDKEFELVDISTGGFSIKVESHQDLETFEPRKELDAILVLPLGKFPIKFETKRRNPSNMTAGFGFRKIPQRSRDAIVKSFDMVTLAHGMKLIQLTEPNKSWLHSDTGGDFVFHFENKVLKSFTIFMQKEFISWNMETGLNTGKIDFNFDPKDDSEELLNLKLSSLIPDKGISRSKIKRLASFIKANQSMQGKLKDWILEKLQ